MSANWGGEPPYAYDDDEGITLWTIGVFALIFIGLAVLGVIAAGGPS